MPDRVQCHDPECPNTILPSTAERTGGLCMPCARAAATRERDEHIRKNRRDVDEFAGVTDPVEILSIIHRHRLVDPLINWIPHPTPTERIYGELDADGEDRLAMHAASLIGSERSEEAETIVLCLATFTDARLDDCLRALVAHGTFRPSLPFHRSPPDVRDALIAKVEEDDGNRRDLLLALAWIGDATVAGLFEGWRRRPPPWRETLDLPPQDYANEAGWEVDEDGRRRDLYFHRCTKLVRGPSTAPRVFKAITDRVELCPWCDAALIDLVDVAPAALGIAGAGDEADRIQVTTCGTCTAFDTTFGVLDAEGRGRWSPSNSRPEHLADDCGSWRRLPTDSLTPAAIRPPLCAADQFLPTTFSQVGGHPTWIQGADYPRCPACSETMTFLAQIDTGDIDEYSEGTYYAFVCPTCLTTATTYQQS